jgi:hypothetical protein
MTRRSPRAGGSSQERPRLAGKEPGAYRATTTFVHFRETPYGLAMSLVENRRENGRICHEHVASLGSKRLRRWWRRRLRWTRRLSAAASSRFSVSARPQIGLVLDRDRFAAL